MNPLTRPVKRPVSLATKARALSVVLAEEFDAPFVCYDALGQEVGEAAVPDEARLSPAAALELAAGERAALRWRPGVGYQLSLVVRDGESRLVAVALLPTLAAAARQPAEQQRLLRWALAVADRLRLTQQLANEAGDEAPADQLNRAWSLVLGLNDAIRQVRLHREEERPVPAILATALPLLGVQALLWVPEDGSAPACQGDGVLAAEDARALAELLARSAPRGRPGEPVLMNEDKAALWSARWPAVRSVLAAAVADGGRGGWLIAANKRGGAFRRSDVAAFLPFASLLEVQVRNARRFGELKELLVGLTRSLTAAIDAKDANTAGHSERVARIGVELGREMGLQEADLNDIYLAGLLHDIGKIGVRDAVLQKRGPLTPEEYDHVKQHVTIGYHMLSGLQPLHRLLAGVLSHHERYDGRGYPHGLSGEQIPLLARILAVADGYDAMSTRRPYREALTCEEAERALTKGSGSQWDARVVAAFLRCRQRVHQIRQQGVGDSLKLALTEALGRADGGSVSFAVGIL